jgi:hypothetical protein
MLYSQESSTTIALLFVISAIAIVCIYLVRKFYVKSINAYRTLLSLANKRFDKQEFLIKTFYFGINRPILLDEDWSIAYDQANLVLDKIISLNSFVMLELGSGISTVIWSVAMMHNANNQLLSMEGKEDIYNNTKRLLCHYGATKENVRLLYAPYKEYTFPFGTAMWYDLDVLKDFLIPIDILFIDGPPDTLQPLSRYPALPLLWNRLSVNCVVIMDDGARADEQEIIRRWLKEFPELEARYVATQKGTWILRKKQIKQ